MKPVLFYLPGGRPLFSYGVLLGVGLLLAFLWTSRRGRHQQALGRDRAGNAALLAIAVGLLGARLTYVWLNPELVAEAGSAWWDIQAGGLSGMGGVILGLLAAALYLRLASVPIPLFADACAPALGVLQSCACLGAYLFGSEFGVRLDESAPSWLRALGTFPRWEVGDMFGPPVLVFHIDRYYLPLAATETLAVQPVQLYGVLLGMLAIGLVFLLERRRPAGPAGLIFVPVAALLLLGRYSLEYLRDDPDRGVIFGLSTTQHLCILGAPLLWLSWLLWRRESAGQLSSTEP